MSESDIENTDSGAEELNQRFRGFDNLDSDRWGEIVEAGIPLYQELKGADDDRAENVRGKLLYTKDMIENSGAGDAEERQRMIAAITEALQ